MKNKHHSAPKVEAPKVAEPDGAEPEVVTHAVAFVPGVTREVIAPAEAPKVEKAPDAPLRGDVVFAERAPLPVAKPSVPLILPEPIKLETRRVSQRTIDEMGRGKESISGW